jgi:hypothetical protein
MAKFRVDVDGKNVSRRIGDRIEDGIENAASEINDETRKIAKQKIRSENAIFNRELLEGFVNSKVEFGDSTVASLRNLSRHAPYQERGVSGTQVQRDTPHKYTDTKPPLDDLIPWVKRNLTGSGFWPDDLPGDGPPGDSGTPTSRRTSSSVSGSGGVQKAESEIPLDSNGLYFGEPGYITQNINEPFSNTDLFPYQRIVVFNKNEKEYLRGTILEFPDDSDKSLKFELDEVDGSRFNLNTEQIGPYSLAGYEDMEELSNDKLSSHLRKYFDEVIDSGHKDFLDADARDYGLTEPKTDVVADARDFWTERLYDLYKDRSVVKEQVRLMSFILSYKDSFFNNNSAGGSVLNLNGTLKYGAVFLTDSQLNRLTNWKNDTQILIKYHEQKHALSSILNISAIGQTFEAADMIEHAVWGPSGTQRATTNKVDLPPHAEHQLFKDNNNGGKVLGGMGWLKDAYYAAENGPSGIKNYTPNLETGRDEPYKRLHEAANHAWWLQMVAANEKKRNDPSLYDKDYEVFIRNNYSATNAPETLATLEEILVGEWVGWETRLEYLAELYPWLIEAWLEGHNPPNDVKQKLEELGFTIT